MQYVSEIHNDFLVQNQASTTAAFYTDAILTSWVDKAHKWAAGYKKWTFTEGRVSTTFASLSTNEDGYLVGEYPEGWRADSIRLLTIDTKEVGKRNFLSFRKFLEDSPQSSDRIYTDYGLRYYVNPNVDLSGTVTVWGQYTPIKLNGTDTNETTVFSVGGEEGNDAMVELMFSYAKKREKKFAESAAHVKNAMAILDELWKRITEEQFAYQETAGDGMWKRMDYLKGATRDDTFKRDQFY